MAKTYDDFLTAVSEENLSFVNEIHAFVRENGCDTEVKEAKNGYVLSYFFKKDKKKITLMNYVFRKQGMLVRIYARNVSLYQKMLNELPEEMKKAIKKGGDCKRLTGVSTCSPTCTAGYEFCMDGESYQKCRNSAFFWKVCKESHKHIRKMLENEVKYGKIDAGII